ncbi:MAG: multidrug transporter [Bacteroidetes bacterium]|nr:multidrug transporter [Bacteroidota bacterium]
MHSGKNFGFIEVIFWTRKDIYGLLVISSIPTVLYEVFNWHWLSIPWLPIALLGTAVAFVVGFKNNASYDRMWEARKAYGGITNASRSWGIMVKDFISNKHATIPLSNEELKAEQVKILNYHFAWLTALRFQLREARAWEAIYKKHNQEYKDRWFKVEEQNKHLKDELLHYLSQEEVNHVMSFTNKTTQIMAMQSSNIKSLYDRGYIEDFRHMEMEKMMVEFYNQQGVCERIKNFPYPRQYSTLNLYFIKIFVILVPLGMLQEFDKLGGHMIWASIPFSALSTWVFTTMEKIGESTESPFEGSANDIPITAISRSIEIDLKEMFGLSNIPSPHKPENNILV